MKGKEFLGENARKTRGGPCSCPNQKRNPTHNHKNKIKPKERENSKYSIMLGQREPGEDDDMTQKRFVFTGIAMREKGLQKEKSTTRKTLVGRTGKNYEY